MLVDLDHFKEINDRRGHAAGDECLRQTASRLRRVFVDAILVARLGGDEFAVLVRAPTGRAALAQRLAQAASALNRPILWNDATLELGASIGVTMFGTPQRRTAAGFFEEADAALYEAKARGRRTVHVFDELEPAARIAPAALDRVALRA